MIAKVDVIAHAPLMLTMLLMLLGSAGSATPFAEPSVPAGIARQLPSGYEVLASASMSIAQRSRNFRFVAIGRIKEDRRSRSAIAHARPLLIFEQRKNRFVLVGRNDAVILKADQGGQCDPFLESGGTISVKGRLFTVENGVACGQHWTDFVTFRLDDRVGFVFDNERLESWSLNPSDDSDAEALLRDGPQRVIREKPGRLLSFEQWRRAL